MIGKKEIEEKIAVLDNAANVLKQEFVGIDKQIDMIMENLKPWFVFPNIMKRPLIINLVGMTGCGKTSLVKRLSELLNMDDRYYYVNCSSVNSNRSALSFNDMTLLKDDANYNEEPKIVVFDEFQHAGLKGESVGISDNSLFCDMWKIIDEGIIKSESCAWRLTHLYDLIGWLNYLNENCNVILEDGVWKNSSDCLKDFDENTIRDLNDYFNINVPNDNYDKTDILFLRSTYISEFFDSYSYYYGFKVNRKALRRQLEKMSFSETRDFIIGNVQKFINPKVYNFTSSVVFLLSNVDAAYDISFSVDPDMSPDQFHKATEKMSVVDIKEALKANFRNEQIARMGNIFVIYPAFSSEDYKKIISLTLDNYAAATKDEIGISLEFDESVKQLIYDEAVYPTHGTRPIFSSVHEILKSKLPTVMLAISNLKEYSSICRFKYTYNTSCNNIEVAVYTKDSEKPVTIVHFGTEKLRVVSIRNAESDERQSFTALHESGHLVMYLKHHGKSPEKVVSKSVSNLTEGFMMSNIDDTKNNMYTKEDILHEIEICLGGYVAEQLYLKNFGGNTAGASDDLRKATVLASKYVRRWGMDENVGVTTYITEPSCCSAGDIINYGDTKQNEIINNKIEKILKDARDRVSITLTDTYWRKLYIQASQYLAEHPILYSNEIETMYKIIPLNKRKKMASETQIRDYVKNLV